MTDTHYTPGRFVWHEVATPDIEGTKKFYGALFGWSFNEVPMPDGAYTMIMNGEAPVGGVFDIKKLPNDMVPPHWMGYVSVPNVDEAVAAAKSVGGTIGVEPMDIPNVGRMAVIGDGQHAYTTAFKSAQGDPPVVEQPGAGTFCWETLNTADIDAAKAFYPKVYGWQVGDFHGMTTFQVGDKGIADAQKTQGEMPSHWLSFVVVPDLAAARNTVGEQGGKVIVEEIPIPDVGKIAIVSDNVGAFVGLFER